jgi:hypothetical protein
MLLREIKDRVHLSSGFLLEIDDAPLERALGQIGANLRHSSGGAGGGTQSHKDVDPSMEPIILKIIMAVENDLGKVEEGDVARALPSGRDKKYAAGELQSALDRLDSVKTRFMNSVVNNDRILKIVNNTVRGGGDLNTWFTTVSTPAAMAAVKANAQANLRDYRKDFVTLMMAEGRGSAIIDKWEKNVAQAAGKSDQEIRDFCAQVICMIHLLTEATSKTMHMISTENKADASA